MRAAAGVKHQIPDIQREANAIKEFLAAVSSYSPSWAATQEAQRKNQAMLNPASAISLEQTGLLLLEYVHSHNKAPAKRGGTVFAVFPGPERGRQLRRLRMPLPTGGCQARLEVKGLQVRQVRDDRQAIRQRNSEREQGRSNACLLGTASMEVPQGQGTTVNLKDILTRARRRRVIEFDNGSPAGRRRDRDSLQP